MDWEPPRGNDVPKQVRDDTKTGSHRFARDDSDAEHREHSRQVVSEAKATGHKFVQRGVMMECPGGSDHFAHAFRLPAHLVYRGEADDGSLVFLDVNTGKEVKEQWFS
jgi:hypothetical protein